MTRTCRNGHVTELVFTPQGRARCLQCERERCKRYYQGKGKVRQRERRKLIARGWA